MQDFVSILQNLFYRILFQYSLRTFTPETIFANVLCAYKLNDQ